ncbi:MAG: hypothetical protein VX471_01905 [Acidobacteriota bacterium]|nr:hypothetical protein [Acidobacteriota bacterium]MEC7768021.1 hypothetical protein [Acidobacteriota bacterium]|tara:strand:- start:451 stop:1356 length:906 start_codon:yes stop_codon:yes gene_type:complete
MASFVISPHMRLQEWVAHDRGYFTEEGLEYEFKKRPKGNFSVKSADPLPEDQIRGAYQSIESGMRQTTDVSCACHWTINMAAAAGHGKLWGEAYSITPSGIYVSEDSSIRRPEDLANVPIAVGYQSGSHYSTIQALEPFLPREEITLHFGGMLFQRLELLVDREVPAAGLFGGPLYLAEQLGFRKILDTTFMVAALIPNGANEDDVRKYYRALKRAQVDIDLRPERYTHFYKNFFPDRWHDVMDTRRFGPGERVVFLPYDRGIFDSTQRWVADRGIFEAGLKDRAGYESCVAGELTCSADA